MECVLLCFVLFFSSFFFSFDSVTVLSMLVLLLLQLLLLVLYIFSISISRALRYIRFYVLKYYSSAFVLVFVFVWAYVSVECCAYECPKCCCVDAFTVYCVRFCFFSSFFHVSLLHSDDYKLILDVYVHFTENAYIENIFKCMRVRVFAIVGLISLFFLLRSKQSES